LPQNSRSAHWIALQFAAIDGNKKGRREKLKPFTCSLTASKTELRAVPGSSILEHHEKAVSKIRLHFFKQVLQ